MIFNLITSAKSYLLCKATLMGSKNLDVANFWGGHYSFQHSLPSHLQRFVFKPNAKYKHFIPKFQNPLQHQLKCPISLRYHQLESINSYCLNEIWEELRLIPSWKKFFFAHEHQKEIICSQVQWWDRHKIIGIVIPISKGENVRKEGITGPKHY